MFKFIIYNTLLIIFKKNDMKEAVDKYEDLQERYDNLSQQNLSIERISEYIRQLFELYKFLIILFLFTCKRYMDIKKRSDKQINELNLMKERQEIEKIDIMSVLESLRYNFFI